MEFTVENSGCTLHCNVIGEGENLLLIHGVACDSNFYKKTAKILSRFYRVITYDRRGHSLSKARPDADYSVSAQVFDAFKVIMAAGARRINVAACSAGGIVGLELARSFPGHIKKLFLHETPVAATQEIQDVYDEWKDRLHEAGKKGNIAKAMLILMEAMGGMDRDAEPVTLTQQGQNMENFKVFLYHEMDEFLRYARKHEHMKLDVPCILTSGEMDREGLFSKYSPEAAKFINCPYMSVPGYHNLAWDRPLEFAVNLMGAMRAMDASNYYLGLDYGTFEGNNQ